MEPSTLLQTHPLLSILSEADRSKLRARTITKRWKKGAVIFRKGDPCTGLYGVVSGSVVTIVEGENDKTQAIGSVGPGGFVGSLAMFDGGPYHVTAMAREDCRAMFLGRADFKAVVAGRLDLAERMVELLCSEVRQNYAHLEATLFFNVPMRLARAVLYLLERHAAPDPVSGSPSIRFSQREIADLLGLSREWISRELLRWQKAGLVDIRRGQLVVRDQKGVQRLLGTGVASNSS